MKKLFTILTLILSIFSTTYAQTGANVRGQVMDHANLPLAGATISLWRVADSAKITSTTTDQHGVFAIANIPAEKYTVLISGVGHASLRTEIFAIGAQPVDLKTISLKKEVKDMAAVTVVASRPMVEQKIDRTIVNVDASVTNVGATALEVLEKSPGVQIDKDGNISLKGKQGVIVMIDGRPSYISGAELANMLRGMQASQLDQIEIMTNPPAKYDAAGNSGIINIKTKKNKVKGFNGSLTAGIGQGAYFKTNESLNLGYRTGKINLFGSYSFGSNNHFQELSIYRRYKEEDKSTRAIFEQTNFMKRRRLNNNLKIGMDYYLTKNTTLGVVVTGFYNPQSHSGTNTSFLKSPQLVIDSIVTADSYIREGWKNGAINVNMRHQFDSTGRELTADIDYMKYDVSNSQNFVNTTMTNGYIKKYDEKLKGDLPIDIDIYSARLDYTHPLNKETKLEIGWKSSYVITDSRANYFESVNGAWAPDYKKINFFEYKENINAAYVNLNRQFTTKLGMQAGLRYENTTYTGFQYGNPTREDSSFKRSYNSFFPTVYFSYAANKSNQFGLSFGRRIDRPAYQNLNPFLFFLDKYTYEQGNPYLKPQYSNNVELTHIFNGTLTTTINYSSTRDMIVESFDQPDSDDEYNYATIVRRGNIGKRENAGISVNAQIPVGKWLTSMIYTNLNYNKFEGPMNGEMISAEATNLMVNVNNQLKFGKGWSGELSGWYRTKGIEGQIQIMAFGQVSAGVAKQVMKGKGSVKLNVRDIFYTQKVKGEMNFKLTEARFMNLRDSRVANITFSYRFGKPVNGNTQRKKNNAVEEQNRVKIGD